VEKFFSLIFSSLMVFNELEKAIALNGYVAIDI